MSDILNTNKDPELAEGGALFFAAVATLILILAAVIAGKSLWIILAAWVLGGPLVVISLMLALALGEVLAKVNGGGSSGDLRCGAGGKHV
jgi:hypothetical protein